MPQPTALAQPYSLLPSFSAVLRPCQMTFFTMGFQMKPAFSRLVCGCNRPLEPQDIRKWGLMCLLACGGADRNATRCTCKIRDARRRRAKRHWATLSESPHDQSLDAPGRAGQRAAYW